MRIATYNLENLGDGPDERHAALARRIAALDPDVLCLQEVNAQLGGSKPRHAPRVFAALDSVLAATPASAFHRVASTAMDGHGPLDRHNLVVASRHPVIAHRQYWHTLITPPSYAPVSADPPVPPAPVGWDRPALYVALALPGGRRLHIFNLHLRATLAAFVPGQKAGAFSWRTEAAWAEGFFMAAIKRVGQAAEVRIALDRVFDDEAQPLIAVCGDMNAEALEMPVRVLRGAPDDTGNAELGSRALESVGLRLAEEKRFTVLHDGRRTMLDHILVSRALADRLKGVEIGNESLEDEVALERAGRPARDSFHAAVMARFDI